VIDVATPIHHYLTHLAALRANVGDTEKMKGLVKETVKDQNKLTELLKKLGVGNKVQGRWLWFVSFCSDFV
jgi:hypothetical protein